MIQLIFKKNFKIDMDIEKKSKEGKIPSNISCIFPLLKC